MPRPVSDRGTAKRQGADRPPNISYGREHGRFDVGEGRSNLIQPFYVHSSIDHFTPETVTVTATEKIGSIPLMP
jgi:hypothetical protein